MIKKLDIHNFQSHKHSTLEFTGGVNVITGASDNGKSSIVRALCYAITNRPLGDAFISNWARNEKKIIDDMVIKVETDKGTLIRKKSNDFNGYIVNGEVLNAIKTDLPLQVSEFFNLSSINIHKQHDKAFLLTDTSGEVGKFFNSIINLTDIDTMLTLIGKDKREQTSKIKNYKEHLQKISVDLEKLNWIDVVQPKLEKCEALEKQIQKTKIKKEALENLLAKYIKFKNQVMQYEYLSKARSILEECKEQREHFETYENKRNKLRQVLNNYKTYLKHLNTPVLKNLDVLKGLVLKNDKLIKMSQKRELNIKGIKKIIVNIENNKRFVNSGITTALSLFNSLNLEGLQQKISKIEILKRLLFKIKNYRNVSYKSDEQYQDLITQLPDKCPTCGKELS